MHVTMVLWQNNVQELVLFLAHLCLQKRKAKPKLRLSLSLRARLRL